jgi:hypothetical protein
MSYEKYCLLLAACLAMLLSAACAASPTVHQLVAMNDEDLCQAIKNEPLRFDAGAIAADRGLRCHPAVEACDAMGYGPDVPIEVRSVCVNAMLDQIKQQQAAEAEQQRLGIAAFMASQAMQQQWQPPKPTVCSPVGRSVVCQ